MISRENYQEPLWPLPITSLLFVGAVGRRRLLDNYGGHTIGNLARLDREALPPSWAGRAAPSHDYAHWGGAFPRGARPGAARPPNRWATDSPSPAIWWAGRSPPRRTELADEVAVRLLGPRPQVHHPPGNHP